MKSSTSLVDAINPWVTSAILSVATLERVGVLLVWDVFPRRPGKNS